MEGVGWGGGWSNPGIPEFRRRKQDRCTSPCAGANTELAPWTPNYSRHPSHRRRGGLPVTHVGGEEPGWGVGQASREHAESVPVKPHPLLAAGGLALGSSEVLGAPPPVIWTSKCFQEIPQVQSFEPVNAWTFSDSKHLKRVCMCVITHTCTHIDSQST